MLTTEKREKILKIHELLPGRYVTLKSMKDTKSRGWISQADRLKHLIGEKGCVKKVHENVFEAVKVHLDCGDERFWSYQDLELISIEPEPRIFHYDVSLLNTGV